MADDFDYASLWNLAQEASDALAPFQQAGMRLSLLNPERYYRPGLPPAFRHGKQPLPVDYAKRYKGAVDEFRETAGVAGGLLAEERFAAPLAGVWPPSASRDLTMMFSAALNEATRGAEAVARHYAAASPGDKRPPPLPPLGMGLLGLPSVIAQLEQRPEVKEHAYQRGLSKLQRGGAKQPESRGSPAASPAASPIAAAPGVPQGVQSPPPSPAATGGTKAKGECSPITCGNISRPENDCGAGAGPRKGGCKAGGRRGAKPVGPRPTGPATPGKTPRPPVAVREHSRTFANTALSERAGE
jgi:hypothetical protein